MRFPEGAFSLCDQMTGHSNKPSDTSRCLPSCPPGICEAARALRDGRVPSTSSALPWLSSYGGGIPPRTFQALRKAIPGHVLQEPGGTGRFPTGSMPREAVVSSERHKSRRPETPSGIAQAG